MLYENSDSKCVNNPLPQVEVLLIIGGRFEAVSHIWELARTYKAFELFPETEV